MAEVIDFYKAKADLELKSNSECESILESDVYKAFLESCERLRKVSAELRRSELALIKTDGEIL